MFNLVLYTYVYIYTYMCIYTYMYIFMRCALRFMSCALRFIYMSCALRFMSCALRLCSYGVCSDMHVCIFSMYFYALHELRAAIYT